MCLVPCAPTGRRRPTGRSRRARRSVRRPSRAEAAAAVSTCCATIWASASAPDLAASKLVKARNTTKPSSTAKPVASTPNTAGGPVAVVEVAAVWGTAANKKHGDDSDNRRRRDYEHRDHEVHRGFRRAALRSGRRSIQIVTVPSGSRRGVAWLAVTQTPLLASNLPDRIASTNAW